ncbi:MAG: aminotransferase class IV [Prolixibacteraceae bacterium]|jgi:branched-chain amino acid aminotransferase
MNFVLSNKGKEFESKFHFEFFNSGRSVYEVIRIIDGIPLFCEAHYQRLLKSVEIAKLPLEMPYTAFRRNIFSLVSLNAKTEGNIKFVFAVAGNESGWAFQFIPHSYPAASEYLNGVATGLLLAQRENPNAKILQKGIRDQANQLIDEQKLFEVLLVDAEGRITEGSRSNVFFVKDGIFYTAHESLILVGITRQKVVECLNKLGCRIVEKAVQANEIEIYDSVFLTGTSPKVLPIRSIGNRLYGVQNHSVQELMISYDQLIQAYIRK